ncbi:hypothetical protein RHGRI_024153 [Rhododendron griersonianum]|uniref:Uncharacterized protein n=1 Tax=Rhododendron griersonianum TaxID=479676 RepID=A0AAV6JBI2_9ERIC|nr:hypothetical protein RHGRI_024153 [Rhododendron griersonianum]
MAGGQGGDRGRNTLGATAHRTEEVIGMLITLVLCAVSALLFSISAVFCNLYTAGSEITMALSLAQGSRLAPIIVAPTPTPTPTPTQELPVEQDGLSATPSSLPQQMVRASTSRRVRGANCGINTERLFDGGSGKKLDVEIPLEVGAPIGENATRFATWLGIQIRMAAPLKNVEKWDDIPFHVKAPIIQATRHVRHGVDRKCKKLYRTWRHNIKDHYEALVEAGKDPYVNPYKGVSGEDWAWMIALFCCFGPAMFCSVVCLITALFCSVAAVIPWLLLEIMFLDRAR